MAELTPVPLPLLLRRAFLECRQEGKIFDLPASKFFRGIPGLDLSVSFHGHRASTPLGPAAGPHGQLAQNIALSWLAGCRIIELKTVQILDELKIPRPCIDVANVGYNVEWSQELTLEQSLREYVSAAMLIDILKASGLLGEQVSSETVFDMSVGYNLDGIRSPRVRGWIESMKSGGAVIDELRKDLAGEWSCYRDLPFPECVSDTVSLSTFHGCPAGEIEGIVTFLLQDLGCHVCIKLNPTLLGQEETAHLLHDVLGYREIQLHLPAFQNDLQWDEALDLIPRLQRVAKSAGRSLSVKFSNTLVVKNHKAVFRDELMYMSGPPLHVLAMNLVDKFRAQIAAPVPISFSGGIDAHNVARAVAMNLVPVTICTDLLRPGGYARLARYFENLGAEMRIVGAASVPEFIMRYRGHGGSVESAGRRNTSELVAEATANPRYRWERNHGVPRKIGSKLWLFDCITCDKCIPVCPNDANFVYETAPVAIQYDNYELVAGEIRRVPGGILRAMKAHQFANYADACNDCGNCEIFCPEDGGPQAEKPRFFGSLEAFDRDTHDNRFFIDWSRSTIYGVIGGSSYALAIDRSRDRAILERADSRIEIRLSDGEPVAWIPKPGIQGAPEKLDMLPYLKLKLLIESVGDPRRVHFANVANLQEVQVVNNVKN
jgi:putative selenate reductase